MAQGRGDMAQARHQPDEPKAPDHRLQRRDCLRLLADQHLTRIRGRLLRRIGHERQSSRTPPPQRQQHASRRRHVTSDHPPQHKDREPECLPLRVVTGLRRNGEEFPVDASISQQSEDGHKFFTVIMRDVTERVQGEQALRQSKEELQLLASAAHQTREQEQSRIARELHDTVIPASSGAEALEKIVAEPPPDLQQFDHRPGAILASMPLHQPVPEQVVAHGPATSSTPLLQRFAAGEGARLVLEHVQVVLQVEHLRAGER